MELSDKIKLLVNEYGVSGDEWRVSRIAAELLKSYTDDVTIDGFGDVFAVIPSKKPDAPTLLLDAHLDQIGFFITEITKGGFLRFLAVGGVDQRMLPGSEVTVITREHGNIKGVIGAVPPHLQSEKQTKSIAIDELTIDIGMTQEQAKSVVRVGDYATFGGGDALDLQNDFLSSKALDDRACFVCILHALELLKGKELNVNLVVCASTKEELGGHGAQFVTARTKPDYAIAVDVTHAKTADAPDVSTLIGKGPKIGIGANSMPALAEKAIAAAKKRSIPFQLGSVPSRSGTNAWSIQPVAEGVATLVVSLPLKYMHSPVEVLEMCDVANTGALLAGFVEDFNGRDML